MKNFIQKGDNLEFAAPYAVTSGQGALVGAIFGVAALTLGSGERGVFAVSGVFELAKVSAQAWSEGALIYWDNAARLCTTVSSGNTLIGVASEVAANPTPVGRVRLRA